MSDEKKPEERRVPNFLHNEEQHMKIKNEIKLTEYQINLFRREKRYMEKAYAKLMEGCEDRAKAYKVKYRTREELDAAYMVSEMTVQEYMRQRSHIWQAYSDRGYIKRIEWLDKMLKTYEQKRQNLEDFCKQQKAESDRARQVKWRRKKHHAAYMRQQRARARRAEREVYYRRWKEGAWKNDD